MSGSHTPEADSAVDLKPFAVSIGQGDGLIARFDDIVMYIADPTASADRLIAAIEAAADAERPSEAVAARLATLAFGADHGKTSPFGVVAPTDDGLLLILRGTVAAEIKTADDTRKLSGDRALTWVDEILPQSVVTVAVSARGDTRPPDSPHTDLRAGVVPGGGFALRRAGDAAGPATQPTPTPESQPIPMPESQPPPTPESEEKVGRTTEVTRLPDLSSAQDGSALPPVVGVLGSEDGSIYPLDRSYVIGRDPVNDAAIRNATASPIVILNDPYVSRVHAYVSIDGGAVFVRDAFTPGGTFIAPPGAEVWTPVGTSPTKLRPGWSLRVGEQILTYHT